MKTVLLVNGSPKSDRKTAAALGIMEAVFAENGVKTEYFQLGTQPVRGCIDCHGCDTTGHCQFSDDSCNSLIDSFHRVDGIVIGTPVYFASANGALCALLDRAFYAMKNAKALPVGKPAAAVAVCWRAGSTSATDRINKYFTYSQMPVVSSKYWNGYLGEGDKFGASVLKTLAKNMVEMLGE